jgi:hypothetical protein
MADTEVFVDMTKFTGVIKNRTGVFHYKEGNIHREDGPATEYADGSKYWYKEDKLHREDGPAVEYPSGTKEWWLEGKRHRTDGPAVEYLDGRKEWFKEGLRHRVDGPAIERTSGQQDEYFINGAEVVFADFVDHLVSDQDIFIGIENGYAKFLNSDEVTEIYCGFFIKQMEKEIKKIEKLKIVLELLQTKETK